MFVDEAARGIILHITNDEIICCCCSDQEIGNTRNEIKPAFCFAEIVKTNGITDKKMPAVSILRIYYMGKTYKVKYCRRTSSHQTYCVLSQRTNGNK